MTGLPTNIKQLFSKSQGSLHLNAGDFYFGSDKRFVHTILGSCVSITLWHPQTKMSGMCHFAVPRRDSQKKSHLEPRYAEDCIELFKNEIKKHGTRLEDYQAKLFGGGNMRRYQLQSFNSNHRLGLGEQNVSTAMSLLVSNGFNVVVADVGEFGSRKVIFDTETGDVWVKFTSI